VKIAPFCRPARNCRRVQFHHAWRSKSRGIGLRARFRSGLLEREFHQ
jgi:hypothetical protein